MRLSRDSEKAQCLRIEITSLLNKGAVEERVPRHARHGDALSGVLQSDLLGAQERRDIQASIRLKVPERLRSQGEVQNDYSQGSDTRVAQGGLGGKCRFERRLLPRPHTQEVTPTTAICSRRFRRGQGLSVPRPTVRTNFPATGIHKGDITYRTLGARARRLSPAISRRLNSAEHRQVAVTTAGKMVARGLTSCGTRAQCTEVSTSSYTTLDPHRRRISPGCRADISTHGQSSTDRAEGVFSPIWHSLLGIMSSATDAIPLGRLHLRPLEFYLLAHWKPASRILSSLIPVKHDLIDHHLRWWLDRECTRAGMILDVPEAQVTLFTDASGSGWGAHVNQFQASGVWSPREAILHINALEMLAVRNSLTAFRTQLAGLTVQLMSDNATVVSYLSKQGGTVSMNLYSLAREVLLLARDLHIFLLVKHIPGDRNALADLLSRKDKVVHTEWTLVQSVVDTIFNIWDKPNVDLFAT